MKADVIFLIFSSPDNFLKRNSIRQTWFKGAPKNYKILFVIGAIQTKYGSDLRKENYLHKDLLLLNMRDSYVSLTQKLLQSFCHLVKKYEFKFVFKGDDDTYVNLELFSSKLVTKNHHKLYWGYFVGNARIKTLGKWKENNWFLCDRYLPYARGGGYVLSYDLANFLSLNSALLNIYQNEDVSLGVWLSPLNIERSHDKTFNTEFKSRGCNNKYLVLHKISMSQMYEYNNNSKEKGKLCKKEISIIPSYEYNWKVPPSQCCIRNDTLL